MFIGFSAKYKSFRLAENIRRYSKTERCTSFFGSKNKYSNRFDRCQVIILEFKSIFAVQFDNIEWLKTIQFSTKDVLFVDRYENEIGFGNGWKDVFIY